MGKQDSRIRLARLRARPKPQKLDAPDIPNVIKAKPIDHTKELIEQERIRGCCICGGINYPLFESNGKQYAATVNKQPLVKYGEQYAHQVCLNRGKNVRR